MFHLVFQNIFYNLPLILTFCLILFVFYTDFVYFIIPNWLNISILLLCPFGFLFQQHMPSYLSSIIAFGIIFFGVGAFFFSVNNFGGGDWKMLSALAPWLGVLKLLDFFIIMSLAGGVEIIILLLLRKIIPENSQLRKKGKMRRILRKNEIPYGLAIASAAIICLIPVFRIYK